MTHEEIIEMARNAWLSDYGVQTLSDGEEVEIDLERLEAFAELVAAKEREACAKVADDCKYEHHISLTSMPSQNGTAVGIANRIRARGETTLRGEA